MAATLTVVESDGPVNREWSHWPAPADGPTGYVVTPRTVTDPATGLVWQREGAQNVAHPSGGFSFAAARAYCDDLTLDGQTDWRMPTLVEAMSIVDSTRGTAPALNPSFGVLGMVGVGFLRTTWVTTPIILPVNPLNNARVVNYDAGTSLWDSSNEPNGIRCVRGGRVVANALPPARYTTAADTVRDEVTGLTWQRRTSPMLMTWSQGDTYCRTLNLGGFSSGWRLPSLKELNSLLDPNRFDTAPAINETAFPGAVSGPHWSASRSGIDRRFYYTVSFSSGTTQGIDPAYGARISVRCVR
jgi:hypothetical protein